MTQLYSNNSASTLLTTITDTATSLELVSATGFPSPTGIDYFLITFYTTDAAGNELTWEIMKCTSRTGNVLTVVRAQEDTVGFAWQATAKCQLRSTAGTLSVKADKIYVDAKPDPVALSIIFGS